MEETPSREREHTSEENRFRRGLKREFAKVPPGVLRPESLELIPETRIRTVAQA